ncbi:hypothetical protein ABIA30_001159 [Mycobacterium sp. MAA66]
MNKMRDPLISRSEQLFADETDLDYGTSVPAMVAYLIGMIALLTGYLALGAGHLYLGATALFIAFVSVALGSLWVLARLIQHPHHSHHGARH